MKKQFNLRKSSNLNKKFLLLLSLGLILILGGCMQSSTTKMDTEEKSLNATAQETPVKIVDIMPATLELKGRSQEDGLGLDHRFTRSSNS